MKIIYALVLSVLLKNSRDGVSPPRTANVPYGMPDETILHALPTCFSKLNVKVTWDVF